MNRIVLLATLLLLSQGIARAQSDSIMFDPHAQLNAAQRLLSGNYASAVTVGVYGEMLYSQPEGGNGELDVERMVVLFGYRFNDRVQFVTELEIEHVEEVAVEQAFVNYNIADNVNLRGGLMLVPMGIINEFHEPTTFNGVHRPALDNVIVPTTWRELGVGVSGRFNSLSLGYQAYIFNGFKSVTTDGEGGLTGLFTGASGLRGGRQKGIESTIDSPTFSAKLDYYGFPGLRLGLSTYFGKTQVEDELESFEGAKIGVAMIGLDARYAYKRFTARGEFVYSGLSDTAGYNALTGSDLGSALMGWYLEGAYNLLPSGRQQKLFAFLRYENYNTHADTAGGLLKNEGYDRTDITTGLSYHIAPGVVVKGDYQFRDNALQGSNVKNQLNFGIGVWF